MAYLVLFGSLVLLGALGGLASAASPRQADRANRAAAIGMAKRLLADVVLPRGTSEVSRQPAGSGGQLERPVTWLLFAAQVDRPAFWITNASQRAAIASVRAHLPRAARPLGSGYAGSTVFAAWGWPVVDRGVLGIRQLALETVPLSRGGVGVRADAQVQYIAPRPQAQKIPSAARVLRITIRNSGQSRPSVSLTVTKRAQVREIARIVDGLPIVGSPFPVPIHCPAIPASPVVRFVFRASVNGRVLARVRELAETPVDAGLCEAGSLTVRGHHEPGLANGGRLLREAGRLLGVKLTRRSPRPQRR
jgi:hypothetical protein